MTPQKRFQQLFREFNCQFFGDRLPPYRITLIPPMKRRALCGDCDKKRRRIRIAFCDDEREMAETLIHEMAHAASNQNHGPKFHAELARLHKLGAPLGEPELNELRGLRLPKYVTRDEVYGQALEVLGENNPMSQEKFISSLARDWDMPYAAFRRRYWWVPKVWADARQAVQRDAAMIEKWRAGQKE